MNKARAALLLAALLGHGTLLLSYLITSPSPADFGRVPKRLYFYLVAAALVAYICHLAFVALLVSRRSVPDGALYLAAWCVGLYCALQVAFIPLVRLVVAQKSSVWTLRTLLILCILPMVVLAGTGIEVGGRGLTSLGLIVTAHVVLNDAVVYGFLV